ncbi:hypothetical protein BD410DRAFT_436962 [Rickenella mellea]|uniref:DUF6533 domain-containing protein n=1 Tax=Rickenella mellea TaxID=50990 RepID=A0A4Y7PX59_9AGAM|nr:hypothetical protein BD410DRAFT_436962 [Rickenella mellea]
MDYSKHCGAPPEAICQHFLTAACPPRQRPLNELPFHPPPPHTMSSLLPGEGHHTLYHVFFDYQAAKYVTIASTAILVWDYWLTFSDEVRFLWPSRWSFAKCLFFLNRYLVFVDPVLLILLTIVFRKPGENLCETGFHVGAWISLAGFSISFMILMLRTWAIWERNRIVTAIMLIQANAFLGADIYFIRRYVQGTEYLPYFSTSGCTIRFHNRLIFIGFIQILVSETTMVILLAIKARQHYRLNQATWLTRVYEDGFIQYLLILANSILNVILLVAAGGAIQGSSIVLQQVMHSVLCNRVLFRVRGAYQRSEKASPTMTTESVGVLTTMVPATMLHQLSTEWSTRPPSEHSYDAVVSGDSPSHMSDSGDIKLVECTNVWTVSQSQHLDPPTSA